MTKERLRKIIGENVRRERISRDISMDEFAEMLTLTPGFIGLIERGQRGTTSSTLYRIADIFGASIDSFFESKDELTLSEVDSKNKRRAKREKISSLIFDFSGEELEYVIKTLIGLRELRGMGELRDEEDDDESAWIT